jgi:septum formation protein
MVHAPAGGDIGLAYRTFVDTTYVYFRDLADDEIAAYIASGDPFDKAGAYGIQEWIGCIGVTGLNGSYYNVMGLPIQRIYQVLKSLGVMTMCE